MVISNVYHLPSKYTWEISLDSLQTLNQTPVVYKLWSIIRYLPLPDSLQQLLWAYIGYLIRKTVFHTMDSRPMKWEAASENQKKLRAMSKVVGYGFRLLVKQPIS